MIFLYKHKDEGKTWKYKRIGRCQPSKCGAFCCRIGPLCKTSDDTPRGLDEQRYFSYMGLSELGSITVGKKKIKILGHTTACSQLKGLRCSIHKERPNVCKDFPVLPSQEWFKIAKQHGCTYKFVKVKL